MVIKKTNQLGNPYQRLVFVDVLRSVAIVGVVIIHGLDQILRFASDQSSLSWWYANLFNSSVRWVLPAFFMISGLLLLPKHEDLSTFLTKRLKRIVVPILVWSALYGGWTWSHYNSNLTIKDQLIATFVHGTPYYHLYFLFAILGFYLLNPLLSTFARHTSHRRFTYVVTIFLAMASVANVSIGWFLHAYPGTRLTSLFQWLPYTGYYLAGLYLHTYPLVWSTKKIILVIASLIALAAAGTYVLTSTFGHGPQGVLFQDYLSPNVVAVSLLVFTLFTRIKEKNIPPWIKGSIKGLAEASFGIYLIHLMVMESLGRIITPLLSAHELMANIALISSTLVVSYVVITLASLIPFIKKTVGY